MFEGLRMRIFYAANDSAEAMAEAIVTLLTDEPLRRCLAENATRDAHQRFDLAWQVEAYLSWYKEILARIDTRRSNGRDKSTI